VGGGGGVGSELGKGRIKREVGVELVGRGWKRMLGRCGTYVDPGRDLVCTPFVRGHVFSIFFLLRHQQRRLSRQAEQSAAGQADSAGSVRESDRVEYRTPP